MTTKILLLPIDNFDRGKAEGIEADVWADENDMFKAHGRESQDFLCYDLTDFMDACNDEEINLNDYWITYFFVNS